LRRHPLVVRLALPADRPADRAPGLPRLRRPQPQAPRERPDRLARVGEPVVRGPLPPGAAGGRQVQPLDERRARVRLACATRRRAAYGGVGREATPAARAEEATGGRASPAARRSACAPTNRASQPRERARTDELAIVFP